MGKPVHIALDAMGGDFAPLNEVLAAVTYRKAHPDVRLLLVGDRGKITQTLSQNGAEYPDDLIIHASQVVGMGDKPTEAVRGKPDSSLVVGCGLVRDGKADAFVSAGNTGAVVAASTFIMGRLQGVERPTIGTFLPNMAGITTVFDVGAFVDSKPAHLLGYARMATIFVREVYGIPSPTIGLLTVGEEEQKGGKVTKETFQLLKNSSLNFVGNIEGRDVLKGTVHIVICDGFTGNILLKFGESVPKFLSHMLRQHAGKSLANKLRIGLLKGVLKDALKPLDYQEHGGVPLLGVNGVSIIGHGSSTPKAIVNMVRRAAEMVEKDIVRKISESMAAGVTGGVPEEK